MIKSLNEVLDVIQAAAFVGDDEALVKARGVMPRLDDARVARGSLGDEVAPAGFGRVVERLERVAEACRWSRRNEPWLTPGAVQWLDAWLSKKHRLVEWSSGTSTSWYGRRVGGVVAVEHDAQWWTRVCDEAPRNCAVLYAPPGPGYPRTYVEAVLGRGAFDVAVVDGLFRRSCVALCPRIVAPGGHVVIDDAHVNSRDGWGIPSDWELVFAERKRIRSSAIWRVPGALRVRSDVEAKGVDDGE